MILQYLKNLPGFRTDRKIIVFAVDDYGNVRIHSKQALEKMQQAGLKIRSRFDAYDTLETREDMEVLFDALSSVKDKNGSHAVFTPLAVPCNIDFEKIAEENFQQYRFELLTQTFEKLATLQPEAYRGTWSLWKEGMQKGLLTPQFHGREHLNLKVFEEKLAQKDAEVMINLENRSYSLISSTGYPTITFTAAFDFWDKNETATFPNIIRSGVSCFEQVFGYKPLHFNAPGNPAGSTILSSLAENGIRFYDNTFFQKEHLGHGKFKTKINYPGKKLPGNLISLTRNVVFEPCADQSTDWVSYTLKQIEIAFAMKKPAIISSHRVNFCGHIDPKNRERGIVSLRTLLHKIIQRWPDVEFMSSVELGNTITKK